MEAGMRLRIGALLLVGLAVWLGADSHVNSQAAHATNAVAIYDPNPNQLWNRLHSAIFIREDLPSTRLVPDALDPPLWSRSTYLLSKPSHDKILRVLDEFLQAHAERLIRDPLKRTILQRDLWSVFDWTVAREPNRPGKPEYAKEKLELQARLAEVLRRVALTPEEIRALPENYAQAAASGQFSKGYDPAHRDRAFLPPELFDPLGPWIEISGQGGSQEPVAIGHASTFSRSSFLVFVRLPGGRKTTFDYLRTLWEFPEPWIGRPDQANAEPDQTVENPHLPQFPAGTQVALVRQMMLFDTDGKLEGTPITESVQIRVYRNITSTGPVADLGSGFAGAIAKSGQDFFQITLRRPLLFAGAAGGLQATGRDEKEFSIFNNSGPDEGTPDQFANLEKYPPVMETCVECHAAGGVNSVNSRGRLLKPYWLNRDYPQPAGTAPAPVSEHRWWEETPDMGWKQNRFEWGLLNGYWKSSGPLR
jgi:hypothetical protein